jgi:hypothetical protein
MVGKRNHLVSKDICKNKRIKIGNYKEYSFWYRYILYQIILDDLLFNFFKFCVNIDFFVNRVFHKIDRNSKSQIGIDIFIVECSMSRFVTTHISILIRLIPSSPLTLSSIISSQRFYFYLSQYIYNRYIYIQY